MDDRTGISASGTVAPSSRWSTVAGGSGEHQPAAWEELAVSYWYCVYAWWRRAAREPEEAAAWTRGTFGRIAHEVAGQREKVGTSRLREWIVGQLARFAAEGAMPAPELALEFDLEWAESRYADEPPGEPDAIFQRRWALTVLEFTASTLRGEYVARGEDALFTELLPFAGFTPHEEGDYSDAARRTGRTSGAMRKAVFDFRNRQRELLRAFVSDTLLDPGDADSETTALLCACDAPGPEAANAPLPSAIASLRPDEILARAMQSVRMTGSGAGAWKEPSLAEAALLFPQYEIVKLLGRGGMGAVYLGRQADLDRHVAVKLLPLEVSADPDYAERFRREARAMARLSHPHIIGVFDFGTTREGHLYFVMEYVEGANLHDLIHGAGLDPGEALDIMAGVCDALTYAHGKGIVHRDIKPANVMVSLELGAKVADFGLARLLDPSQQAGHTVAGTIMGTPDYMAPEQKRGIAVDHRADLFSLGVMLYEMLCKETPQGMFEPASQRCGFDRRIDAVIGKALAPQPEKRFQNAAEMKAALEPIRASIQNRRRLAQVAASRTAAASSAPASPAPAPAVGTPPAAAAQHPRRSRLPIFLGAGALLAVAAGATYHATRPAPAKPRPDLTGFEAAAREAEEQAAAERTRQATPAPAAPAAEPWQDVLQSSRLRLFAALLTSDGLLFLVPKVGVSSSTAFVLSPASDGRDPRARWLLRNAAIRIRATYAPETFSSIFLTLRDQEGDNRWRYRAVVDKNSSRILLECVDGTHQTTVLREFKLPAPLVPGQDFQLEFRAVGSRLILDLDGALLGEVENSQLSAAGGMTLEVYKPTNTLIKSLEILDLDSPAGAGVGHPAGGTRSVVSSASGSVGADGAAPSKATKGDNRAAALMILGKGGRATIEESGKRREVKSAAELPAGALEVVELKLEPASGKTVPLSDEEVQTLAGLPRLETLTLRRTTLRDADLAVLRTLPRLTRAHLSDNLNLTDEGMTHLAALEPLTDLHLTGCRGVGRVGVARLAPLRNLTGLGLGHLPKLDEQARPALTGLLQLQTLHLQSSGSVTPAFVEALAVLPALRMLSLSPGQMTAPVALGRLPALHEISLYGGSSDPLPAALWRSLADAPALARLYLNGLTLSEAHLAEVAQLPALTTLMLENVQLPATGLAALQGSLLTRVECGGIDTRFDDAALRSLLPLKSLQSVKLAPGSPVTPAALAEFQRARPEVKVER